MLIYMVAPLPEIMKLKYSLAFTNQLALYLPFFEGTKKQGKKISIMLYIYWPTTL